MVYRFIIALLLSMLIPATSVSASHILAKKFPEFSATYDLYYGDTKVGEGYRFLYYQNDTSIRYGWISDISYLFLSDRRAYTGNLTLVGDSIEPMTFEEIRTGVGKDYHAKVNHDRDNQRIHITGYSRKDKNIAAKTGAVDYMSFQLAMRQDLMEGRSELKYDIVDRKKIKTYELKAQQETILETAIGKLKVIPVVYEHHDKKDDDRWKTMFWVSPDLNYEIVRLDYIDEDNELVAHIELSHYQPLVDHDLLAQKFRQVNGEDEQAVNLDKEKLF